MKRLLKEPLLHFLLMGAALFGLYRLANPGASGDADGQIVVSAGRIEQIAGIFARTWQRPPTPEELKSLVDDYVLEEIYYRKALAMGIDKDDTIIRRRLRQKVEFLTEDAAALAEPTDEVLEAYLSVNEERFRTEPVYTFRQIYFNPERHEPDPERYVRGQLALLNAGQEVLGAPTLIPTSLAQSSRREVDGTFGTGFSAELDELTPGAWSGPLHSGLGLHLVRLESRIPGQLPELAVIRKVVAREFANDRRLETKKKLNDQLLAGYEIAIEWPEVVEGEAREGPESS